MSKYYRITEEQLIMIRAKFDEVVELIDQEVEYEDECIAIDEFWKEFNKNNPMLKLVNQ